MAGLGVGPDEDPPDLNRSKLPAYCRNSTNDGVLRILQLRVKIDEQCNDSGDDINSRTKRPPLPQNPFVIGHSVKNVIGLANFKYVEAIKEARGAMYTLRTYSPEIATKLSHMTKLIDQTPVEVVSHPTLNIVQGVVIDYDTIDVDEDDLLEELQAQGVSAVRRIKKRDEKDKDKFRNTPTLVLSFHGTSLPEYVRFGLLRVKTRPYYPSPLFCRNCAAYGHTLKRCDSSAICLTCSEEHTITIGQKCQKPSFCKNCKGDHSPTSRDCPIFQREDAVIRLKVNKGITFQEARAEINQSWNRETYSSKLQQRLNQSQEDEKDQQIKKLKHELERMRKEIENLMQKSISEPMSTRKPTTSNIQENGQIVLQPNEGVELNQTPVISNQTQTPISPENPKKRYSRKDLIQPQDKQTKKTINKTNLQQKLQFLRSISKKRSMDTSPMHINKSKRSNQSYDSMSEDD